MRRGSRNVVVAVLTGLAVVSALLSGVGPAAAAGSAAGRLVSATPAEGTPNVLDGRDEAIAQVGGTMILGGSFTQASNAGSTTVLTRKGLLAFDASTGQISTAFDPEPDGEITSIVPAGDGSSVFVAGLFSHIGGVARKNVARVRVSDGAVLTTFNAGNVNGQIKDMLLSNGRLWIGGAFTSVNGHAQTALATLNPTTGAFDPFMGLSIAGVNNGGTTNVTKMDITPDGSRLAAIGNFDTISGVKHHQLFLLDLSGGSAAVAPFNTTFYTSVCGPKFDSYMRDVDFSPDGSFFVISTTGGPHGYTSACDETSRWETYATGSALAPSWTDYTGGDTTYAVEITDTAVYTGGHFRWQNNAFASDKPGPGAVARTGLAALDPQSGLPMTWNPTRTRGVGVFDFLMTSQGLWMASDTDRVGNYQYHGRIALFPPDGDAVPAVHTPTLPNDVYVGGPSGATSTLVRRSYDGSTVGPTTGVSTGGVDWSQEHGAFMLNGQLYLAGSGGSFTRRSFDGSTYGAAVPVNTQDQLTVLQDWKNDISSATGMFYDTKRIYFTLAGSSSLYYRYFNPQDDVVGAVRMVASGNVNGIDFSQVRGMFTTGSTLYWATPDGSLNSIGFAQGAQHGSPVPGSARRVSGPTVDGNRWNAQALFLFQNANGQNASPSQTQASVSFVDAASTAGNRTRHTVTVPASVQAGDTLVLFLTTNNLNATVGDLPGWTLIQSVDGNSTRGRAWARQATASDAGSTVSVSTSALAKSTLSLTAYRGSTGASEVTASAASANPSTSAQHTTPTVAVSDEGSWLVSYWAEKSTDDTTWTAPSGVTGRTAAAGTGGGNISSLLGDSAGPVPAGTAGGRTATASDASGRVVLFSVVVSPQ